MVVLSYTYTTNITVIASLWHDIDTIKASLFDVLLIVLIQQLRIRSLFIFGLRKQQTHIKQDHHAKQQDLCVQIRDFSEVQEDIDDPYI